MLLARRRYRMTGRSREENWFRYGRADFHLDPLGSYVLNPDDPDRTTPKTLIVVLSELLLAPHRGGPTAVKSDRVPPGR